VENPAELGVKAIDSESNFIQDAVGPEACTFNELVIAVPTQWAALQLTRPASEVGATSSRSAGNPSSPTDIPGFSGGGGFMWTFNNVSDQACYSIAAGMGAAGLTAGAAELATVLGIDIGIKMSMAGSVGVVVGGLTELGFLIADLLSGGPSIPWQVHAPAHSPEGLSDAGQTDQVDQKLVSEFREPDVSLNGGCQSGGTFTPVSLTEALGTRKEVSCGWLDRSICAAECAAQGKGLKRCYYIQDFGFIGRKGRLGLLGYKQLGGRQCECSEQPPCGCR